MLGYRYPLGRGLTANLLLLLGLRPGARTVQPTFGWLLMGLSAGIPVPPSGARTEQPTFGWLLLGLSAGIPGTRRGTDRAANLRLVIDGIERWDTGAPLGADRAANLRLVIVGVECWDTGTPPVRRVWIWFSDSRFDIQFLGCLEASRRDAGISPQGGLVGYGPVGSRYEKVTEICGVIEERN